MIGTQLIEELVQSVVLSHRVTGCDRASLLLLAAPESGKTTIATAAKAKHVANVAMISAKSVVRELREHPQTEYLLFNDLAAIRAMSHAASNALIVMLNQVTQGEHGMIAFAGKKVETIDRTVGVIGCLPWSIFKDHRARWNELGFVSRMIPFAYDYPETLVIDIKDSIDAHAHASAKRATIPLNGQGRRTVVVSMNAAHTRNVRLIADARAKLLKQRGIRLLRNYHAVVRAHALRDKRTQVLNRDIEFLAEIDAYVSTSTCKELPYGPQKTRVFRGARARQ